MAFLAPILAQCSMCRTALQAQGPDAMAAVNHAVLILFSPAILLFSGLFWWSLKYRGRAGGEEDREDEPR